MHIFLLSFNSSLCLRLKALLLRTGHTHTVSNACGQRLRCPWCRLEPASSEGAGACLHLGLYWHFVIISVCEDGFPPFLRFAPGVLSHSGTPGIMCSITSVPPCHHVRPCSVSSTVGLWPSAPCASLTWLRGRAVTQEESELSGRCSPGMWRNTQLDWGGTTPTGHCCRPEGGRSGHGGGMDSVAENGQFETGSEKERLCFEMCSLR